MLLRSENKTETLLALLLVAAGVFLRLLPHPANFAPVSAIAFFGGVILSPAISMTVPLVIMIISDLLIGPHDLYWLTWGAFALVCFVGILIRSNPKVLNILFGTLTGSVLFFILTNLGVFLFQDMYPKTSAGFSECFLMALPFFRTSVLADIFYSAVFFSVFAAAKSLSGVSLRISR